MSVAEVSLASKAFLSAGVINAAMKPSREGRRIQGAVITRLLQCGLAEEGSSVRQLVWRCDRWLQRNHRNDHVYRTRVLNEVLHHERGALALPEFRVNSSKADFLVVGRDLHAFEIKSDVDNLDRLETQLRDYQAIAPRVSLVAPPRLAARVAESQEWDAIGVSTLASDGSIETWRPALADASSLSSVAMLRSLRRPEYLAALASLGHQIPLTPNTRIFAQSTQAAASIDPADLVESGRVVYDGPE